MSRSPARSTILMAGAAAILPATLLSAAPPLASPAQFSPPPARLLLTRTLRSPLADGREIVSRRTYEVVIVADGDGYRVEGALVDVAVDAPAHLSRLAEIERRRPDTGLFPLRLDAAGMLVPERRRADRSALRQAASLAAETVDRALPAGAPRTAAQGFVASLESAAAETRWPEDLFRPGNGRRVDRRKVALPDGGTGQVEVEIVASTGDEDYARMQRTVTTELGASRRVTREEWVLAPARSR